MENMPKRMECTPTVTNKWNKRRCINAGSFICYSFLLIIVLCLFMTGCDNSFAENEYDSVEKIIENEDRYAKESSVMNSINGEYSLNISKFDGRQTLWSDTLEESQSIEMEFSFALTKGQAKIVHIDADGNVTTLIECMPETSTDGYITKTVPMTSGQNRLKIVGYDCENIDLKILFPTYQ